MVSPLPLTNCHSDPECTEGEEPAFAVAFAFLSVIPAGNLLFPRERPVPHPVGFFLLTRVGNHQPPRAAVTLRFSFCHSPAVRPRGADGPRPPTATVSTKLPLMKRYKGICFPPSSIPLWEPPHLRAVGAKVVSPALQRGERSQLLEL